MKILLDECLAQWAGLKSKKNGELLLAAEMAGYDVLPTVDQGIPHQQLSWFSVNRSESVSR
jgi:hypothetical protein